MYSKILESFPYVETKDYADMQGIFLYDDCNGQQRRIRQLHRRKAVDKSKFTEMMNSVKIKEYAYHPCDHTFAYSQIRNFNIASGVIGFGVVRHPANAVAILDAGVIVWYQGKQVSPENSAVCRCENGITLNTYASQYFCKLWIDTKTLTPEFYEYLESQKINIIQARNISS
jgi:hypothetical protein